MTGDFSEEHGGEEHEGLQALSVVLAAAAQIQELARGAIAAAKWQHTNEQSVAAVRQFALAARQVDAAHWP